MVHIVSPVMADENFSVEKLKACLRYVVDSFEWLTADGDNFSR